MPPLQSSFTPGGALSQADAMATFAKTTRKTLHVHLWRQLHTIDANADSETSGDEGHDREATQGENFPRW